MTLRVAVAGATGIGKHHAKWYHRWGCDVVGFLGSSEESCSRTEAALREIFPFAGRGYTSLAALLDSEEPDLVDVCTPNAMHFEHVSAALDAGCHVLCEKPLVWDDSPETLLLRARGLLQHARAANRVFAVCTQYASALPRYEELYRAERGKPPAASRFFAEMETVARGRERDTGEIWIDMGPHPISMLLAWHPHGEVVPGTLRTFFRDREARAEFEFTTASGTCLVDIAVRDRVEGPPVRRFGVDGYILGCTGRADEAGVYRSVLSSGLRETVGEDFMSLLIGNVCDVVRGSAARLIVSGELGLRNLELQLQVLQSAGCAAG